MPKSEDDWSDWSLDFLRDVDFSVNDNLNTDRSQSEETISASKESAEKGIQDAKPKDDVKISEIENTSEEIDEDDIPLSKIREEVRLAKLSRKERGMQIDDIIQTDASSGSEFKCPSSPGSSSSGSEPPKPKKIQRKRNRPLKSRKKLFNSTDVEVKRTLNKSAREHAASKQVLRYHKKRLQALLASNSLDRMPVSADGNCFINAVLTQLGTFEPPMTTHEFRTQIANHLLTHKEHYRRYLTTEENYESKINELTTDGLWDTTMADLFPLAVANIYHRKIRIFSSHVNFAIRDIVPDMIAQQEQPTRNYILLAHLAVQGHEHYDVAIQKDLENLTSIQEQTTSNTTARVSRKRTKSPHVTPHKDAIYISPPRKSLTRKRKRDPSSWIRNIRQHKRNLGQAYTSMKGCVVEARRVKSVDCGNCRFKCSINVTEENRKGLFDTYWNLGDYQKQRNFICNNVVSHKPKRSKNIRNSANEFYLSVGTDRKRVCKKFFLATLDLGQKTVSYALTAQAHGTFTGCDKRGKQSSSNKTPETDKEFIREHIKSFPQMESHYTRKDTNRKYLEKDLNVRRMWQLYKDKCNENKRKPVGEKTYRDIFCTEFNLSFFKPKKDQCSLCNNYTQLTQDGNIDTQRQAEFDEHQSRKLNSRQEKQRDKDRAQEDFTFYAATFDLQAVLTTPCSLVGDLYYKRKLSCYNLSFYSLGDRKGVCYLWDESHAERGSCEVATCIYMHIKSLPITVTHVTLYADTCGGQNRNQFVAACLIHCVKQLNHLKELNLKFFERGHSEMESDSIHSAIETAKKRTQVYVPSQWHTVVHLARKKLPYLTVPVKYNDILNFKKLAYTECPNMKTSTTGSRVNWLKVKWIQVKTVHPDSIFLNYGFDETNFLEILTKRNNRGRPRSQWPTHLENLYPGRIPISEEKKKDLLSLCHLGVIPGEHKAYYENLSATRKKRDKLPTADIEESSEDDE